MTFKEMTYKDKFELSLFFGVLSVILAFWAAYWVAGARFVRVIGNPAVKVLNDAKNEIEALGLRIKEMESQVMRVEVTEGVVSWYGDREQGNKTANGEVFEKEAYTIAHRSLPFGTVVIVENVDTGAIVPAVVNDRGPFVKGRIADLSEGLARRLGFRKKGLLLARIYEVKNF